MITTSVVDIEKSILLTIPTVTGSQSEIIHTFCKNLRATSTSRHRRILWLVGPTGCGKHFVVSACFKGIRVRGMIAAYIDCTNASGESKSYYALLQDLNRQIVDQLVGDLPAELNPHGRSESELQTIFGGLIRFCAPDIINIFVSIPVIYTAEAVRFVNDIKSIAQEYDNVIVSALMGENSEAKGAIESTQLPNDPREELLHLGLPSIDEYKNLAWTFADALERAIPSATAALIAATAMKLHAPPSYVYKLVKEASRYTSFEISDTHIATALQALDLKPLEPLKEPITAVPILQAYASIYLTDKRTKKVPEGEPIAIPKPDLLSVYNKRTLDEDIPTISPTMFEDLMTELGQREIFTLNNHSLALNPKFCYTTYLHAILSWDYWTLAEQAPNNLSHKPQRPDYAATIDSLYIGHLAALHAIVSLYLSTPADVTSPQAYIAYVDACAELGISPVKRHPGFKKVVDTLAAKRFLKTKRVGRTVTIAPLIDQHKCSIIHDRFSTLKTLAHTPPTLLSDEEIAAKLTKAPTQRLALTAINHILRDTGKNQVYQSEVYPVYADLCAMAGTTPKKQSKFTAVIAALEKGGHVVVQRGRIGDKPANTIKLC